jgi:hypothetical protein
MNALVNKDETTPSVAMELLVARHGAWVVLVAFVALLMRPKREEVRLDDLSPYLRRDMGLPSVEGPKRYWELR